MEEAGIDGGGIFKDFMENVTQAAFDVQYGLFKVFYSSYFSFVKIMTLLFKDFFSSFLSLLSW